MKEIFNLKNLLAYILTFFMLNNAYAENLAVQGPPMIEVPFDYLFIPNSQIAYIQYDSKDIYRGVRCEFFKEPYVDYIATWHYGDEDMIARGPNKGHALEIIFASPVQSEINADSKGRITIRNPEKYAFTFKCKFIS